MLVNFDPSEMPALFVLVMGTFAGGVLPLLGRWRRDTLSVLLSFGSGVLLAVIFLQMIPPVVGILGAWGGLVVLGGFVSTSLLETGLHAHRHTGGHGGSGRGEAFSAPFGASGLAVAIGLGLHSVLDGLALGTGMGMASLAPSLFLAILIHKGPDAFALSTVLLAGGHPLGRILKIQGIFSLTTPLAALGAMVLLRGLSPQISGLALGAAAGTLLAVATEDLLPEVHRRGGKGVIFSTMALLGGILLVASYQYFLHLD